MKHRSFILSWLMVFCLAVGVSAADYNLALQATTDGNTVATVFKPGDPLYLNIDLVAPATGKVAGCAFTLTYDATKLTGPATDANGLPVTPTDIQSSLLNMTINNVQEKTHRVNSSTSGLILFSGAAIDKTGGAGFSYQDATLFTVKFTVQQGATGNIVFTLKQTTLTNATAGWNGEGVPVLVGAIPNTVTSCTGWAYPNTACKDGYGGDLSDDFPILLQNFAVNPSLTVSAGTDPYIIWRDTNYPGILSSGRDMGPLDDWDHDGFTNDQERLSGTNPTVANGTVPTPTQDPLFVTKPNLWTAVGTGYNALTDFRVANLDIDGDGKVEINTDATLLSRHLQNKTWEPLGIVLYNDAALIDGAVAAECTRCDAAKIKLYIDAINPTVFDVDDSGIPALETDATLIDRFVQNKTWEPLGIVLYSDAALIDGAVDTVNCNRCDATSIKAYLNTLFQSSIQP